MILTVGSRDSELARQQAGYVADLLEDETDTRAELQTLESLGDQRREADPGELGEIGIFTSRLDRELADGTFDLVVHSLKDCPTDSHEDLEVGAVPPRTTPFDTLLGLTEDDLGNLPDGTVIGTSSRRRRANLLHENDELIVESCRGNVPTRIEKLEDEDSKYDGLVLAAAGIERLELKPKSRLLRRSEMLPPAGQGALAVMCRSDNDTVLERLRAINHEPSETICRAERTFLSRLEGGCEAPIGALARLSNKTLELNGSVTAPDGSRQVTDTLEGSPENPEELGRQLANQFLEQGVDELLER